MMDEDAYCDVTAKRFKADSWIKNAISRSATLAQMANMPVARLRIWEQRKRAVQPATAASGHRLYSPGDMQRVL